MSDFESSEEINNQPIENTNTDSILQKFAKMISHKYTTDIKDSTYPELEIIDENSDGNILSNSNEKILISSGYESAFGYSSEGFAEDIAKQKSIADFVIQKFACKGRGDFLDVGCGSNIHIADRFAESGILSFAIDAHHLDSSTGESLWSEPRLKNVSANGAEIYSGDIAAIEGQNSQLSGRKYGAVLFNGSWASGGNNFTVAGEIMEFKHYDKGGDRNELLPFMDEEKNKILKACKEHLTPNGVMGIISSRYAFHGAGYSFDQYPDEKLSFVDLYSRFMDLGAKKIYIVGLSQEGLDKLLPREEEFDEKTKIIRNQLKSCKNLPIVDLYINIGSDHDGFEKELIKKTLGKVGEIPALDKIARIDAIFAEF